MQAARRGVQTPTSEILSREGVHFIKVDGVVYIRNQICGIEVIPDANNPDEAFMRPQQAGTYSTDNGVLAFVDPEGALYVGANKSWSRSLEVLQSCGYVNLGEGSTPFSNCEQALSWSTQLDDTKTRLRALDPKLIGDMHETLVHKGDREDIIKEVMDWYDRFVASRDRVVDKPAPSCD